MKKLTIITFCLTLLITLFTGCSSTLKTTEKQMPDLIGEWKQSNSKSEDSYQAATISGDMIEIYWVSDNGDTKSLYWAGSFIAPTTADEPFTWDSKNDHSKTDSAMLASSDDTKTMTYQNEVLSYEVSVMGTTTKVKLQKEPSGSTEDTQNKVQKVENTTEDKSEEKYAPLDILNQLATLSTQTEELYVTGDIVIGENEEVTPGIYDLEITGGSGNILGDRSSVSSLFINWVGGAKGNTGGYPSKIRMILFEGDTLEFSDISKVKFNAVPEKVEPSNELGIGEFIVGRDIMPGDYKLSTNVKLNPEFDNLGWSITIYNDENGESRDQMYTATNDDVVVSLKEGEVISISYDNTDHGSSSDDAKLIFAKF
ncbi:hypothetical protein [Robertmurraya andreesenii]|uniref:Lipocalin-like domain-containing protein n=1 Tax=Anoxybacillus andreesenii TaxID=1325932 RepID=A0ABT9UZL3_9BACL|nr:hypothetical protein [Robertmurraya andreesenii]MDQ0154136.1 hypothetical protein [Robertmurraya andreesenii]